MLTAWWSCGQRLDAIGRLSGRIDQGEHHGIFRLVPLFRRGLKALSIGNAFGCQFEREGVEVELVHQVSVEQDEPRILRRICDLLS